MYYMKKCITKLLIFVTLISCFGVIPSYANESDDIISAYLNILNGYSDKEGGTAKYIVYDIDKNGTPELIIESGVASASILNFYTFDNDIKWLGSKEGSHVSLASVPNKNGILRTSAHSSFQHVSLISIKDNKIEETEIFAEMLNPEEYNEHGYYEPNYFFDGAEDLNFCERSDLSALKKIKDAVSSGTSQTISTADFDLGMAKGVQYFNNGQYYEARDEFQWFCDANWGRMNDGQQQYVLGYLNNAKENVAEIEKENSRLTQQQFDNGMRKGIDYFNKGMYYEARDEFQWFCDANWGKMNDGQRKYALDYLGATKTKLREWESRPIYDDYGNIYKTYDDSIIPLFDYFAGKTYYGAELNVDGDGKMTGWSYEYYFWSDQKKLIESLVSYMQMLESNGFALTGSGDIIKYYYYRRGDNGLNIFADLKKGKVSISVISN